MSGKVHLNVIEIAPAPVFVRLKGADDRCVRRVGALNHQLVALDAGRETRLNGAASGCHYVTFTERGASITYRRDKGLEQHRYSDLENVIRLSFAPIGANDAHTFSRRFFILKTAASEFCRSV